MPDSTDDRPFSHVKHLREIRDRINKKLEHMTDEEALRWFRSREIKDPKLRALLSRAKSPKPPPSEYETARTLGLLPYPKYRPSGVEWLGNVPEHWKVKRLKSVARRPIKNGIGEASIHDNRDWPRYIRITDIASSRRLRSDTFKSLPPALAAKAIVDAHDILFAAVGATYGKSYYHASDETPVACFAGYLVRFSPDVDQVLAAFVAYWAESEAYWALIRSRVIQATIENFSASKYRNLSVPVPPVHEQRAIASYLDRETAKIEALIEKKETLVERLEELRTAVISRTVTRGLPPAEAGKAGLDRHPKFKPSGVEWLGDVPAHWEVKRLKSVARRPIKNGIGEAAIHDNRDWPRYIRITDIASTRRLRSDTFKSLPPALAAKAIVEAHDILFAAVGATYGKSFYHASDETPVACFAGYLVRFSPDVDQVLATFVAYWAESEAYWALIRSRVIQATIENVSASKYRNLSVPIPPLREQHAIASYLDRETTKIDRATELARKEINLLGEYRTRLISDVVTGKVDVRGILGTDEEIET